MPGFYLSGKLWQDEPRKGPLSRGARSPPKDQVSFLIDLLFLWKRQEKENFYILRPDIVEKFSSFTDSVLKELFWETFLHIEGRKWSDKSRAMKENVLTTLTLHEFDFLTFSSSFCHSSYERGIWYNYIVSCEDHPILLIFPLCSINFHVTKYINILLKKHPFL